MNWKGYAAVFRFVNCSQFKHRKLLAAILVIKGNNSLMIQEEERFNNVCNSSRSGSKMRRYQTVQVYTNISSMALKKLGILSRKL